MALWIEWFLYALYELLLTTQIDEVIHFSKMKYLCSSKFIEIQALYISAS